MASAKIFVAITPPPPPPPPPHTHTHTHFEIASSTYVQGCSQGVFFTEALAEFQHVNRMIV